MAKEKYEVKKTLAYLGKKYQRELVKCFMEDPQFSTPLLDNDIDVNMFTDEDSRRYMGLLMDRYRETRKLPTYNEMGFVICSRVSNDVEKEKQMAFVEELMSYESEGIDIVKTEATNFFAQQGMIKHLNMAIETISKGHPSETVPKCRLILQDAIEAEYDRSEYFEKPMDNLDDVFSPDYRAPISTGCPELDAKLEGGIGRGELGVIIAPSGVGKTSATCGFVAAAATTCLPTNNMKGFKVLHIFFEDDINNIRRKYFGYLSGVEAYLMSKPGYRDVVMEALEKEDRMNLLNENVYMYRGSNDQLTTSEIRAKIKRLSAMGKKPDMVIIDYFECLKLDEGDARSDDNLIREGKTMRSLERMAKEFDIAIWCPVQGNRESFDEGYVSMKNSGGSIKKVQIGHVVISFARPQDLKEQGKMNVIINKFRAGAIVGGGVLSGVGFNNGTGRFDMSNIKQIDAALDGDYQATTESIQRQCWNELRKPKNNGDS